MNIILITTSFNDEVHGTFNDKKTGCGISLLKPENVTRYRRGERMTDLGEITCERCKTKIAKEMIKSDQKEMKAILKEERMRAKKGLEDEGIVPLGNTTAKITSAQNVPAPEPEPAPAPVQEPPKPAYQANGAPALDNDLAKFAIKKPDEAPEQPSKNEFVLERPKLFDDEPANKPQPEPEQLPAAEEDDFLAQFAIQKPDESEVPTEENEEEDFLAQFAVSAPQNQEPQPEEPETPPVLDDISAALSAMEQSPLNAAPKAPEPMPEPASAPVPNLANEDDIMKMFAIGAPSQSEEKDDIVIEEKNITAADPEPVEEASMQDFISEWDLIANQLFGESSNVSDTADVDTTVPENDAPVLNDIAPVEAPKAPVVEEISAPVLDDIAPVEAPKAPVLDDISAALSAMEQSPLNAAPKAPILDDIAPAIEEISAPVLDDIAPVEAPKAPVLDDIAPVKTVTEAPKAPVVEEISAPALDDITPVEAPKAPVLDDIAPVKTVTEAPKAPVIEEISAPVLDDIAPVEAPKAPILNDIAPIKEVTEASEAPVVEEISAPALDDITPVEAPKAPVLDDIAPVKEVTEVPKAPVIEEISAPVLDDIAPVEALKAPVLDDIAPVKEVTEAPKAPVIEEISAPEAEENERPILEDIVDDDDELELISESLEPKTPVLDNISDAISAMNFPASTAAPAPAPVQAAPVLNDISAALSALNANPVQPVPVSPVPVQPIPTVPVQPIPTIPAQPIAPAPVQPAAPTAGAVGQVISVPQLTGYNDKNQPIYTYVQMQIQGYDKNGQPILVPLPGQNIPVPTAPTTFAQTFNQNTRLRDAVAAAKEIPTSAKDMTPGQRIAAAEAAKGSPLSANVSKIATNPHTKSTSQAFISAISVSKEYANQSLTETQGLKQRTGVLDSIEDVLSQLGDNSLKEKKIAEAKAQSNVPSYQEYKAPSRTSSYSPKPAAPKAPTPAPAPVNNRPLTKAELKAKKKQDKIDAKFQKEMSKRK